ncbi:MAG: cation:proton antiporter subunit C [Verrucomicrobiota bacterium]
MAEFIHENIEPYFNYWVYVIIMMIGLWALIAKNNLIKKLIGLSIFQTAIILLYVSVGVKDGATIPILGHHGHMPPAGEHRLFGELDEEEKEEAEPAPKKEEHHAEAHHEKKGEHDSHDKDPAHDDHHGHGKHAEIDPDLFANPLPHVLMLTAIVVGVATLGVALSITQVIFREFGTLEEDEILAEIKSSGSDG